MSSKIWHDAVNNILHVTKEDNSPNLSTISNVEKFNDLSLESTIVPTIDSNNLATEPLVSEKPDSLRGFIVNVADNEQHAQDIREGKINEAHFMPILANSEEEAMAFIQSQGKIPLSFSSYEYLKFQIELIESLSREENISLKNDSLFSNENIVD